MYCLFKLRCSILIILDKVFENQWQSMMWPRMSALDVHTKIFQKSKLNQLYYSNIWKTQDLFLLK